MAVVAGAVLGGLIGASATVTTALGISATIGAIGGAVLGGAIGGAVEGLTPDIPSVDYNRLPTASSPTYSSKFRQNQARVGGAIPIIIGEVKFYPDIINTPYRRYRPSGEITYYIMSLGNSDLESNIEFFVGNSPIDNFKGLRSLVLSPGLSGGNSYEWIAANDSGSIMEKVYHRVNIIDGVSGAELVKDADNDGVYGEYLFPAMTQSGNVDIYLNFICQRGLYTLSSGNPVADSLDINIYIVAKHSDQTETVIHKAVHTINGSSTVEPLYSDRVVNATVAVGDVIGVTVERLDNNRTTGGVNSCNLGQVFMDSLKVQSDDVWRALFRIEANAELAKAAETKIMAKVTNPNASTVRQAVEYVWQKSGLNLSDLDATILDTADVTTINGVLDTQLGVHDTLKKLVAIARAYPVRSADGKTTFFVDRARAVDFSFDDSNIVENSIKPKLRLLQDTDNDGVKVRWFDADSMVEQFATYPANSVNPRQVDLFGCTDGNVAHNHAMYLYKKQQYQNKTITWDTELEGNMINVGDVVTVDDSDSGISETVIITSINPTNELVTLTGINYDERVYQ